MAASVSFIALSFILPSDPQYVVDLRLRSSSTDPN
jgi:hypothetical protein